MFTGIIEELGEISAIRKSSEGGIITIKADVVAEGTKIGDSISVNGVCLTVVDIGGRSVTMDILGETLKRSTLAKVSVGEMVNLERSLQPSSRLGGHFVFGHIDCRGSVVDVTRVGRDWVYRISVDESMMPFIAEKGSIAVDGISLTVAETAKADFTVHVVPHTYDNTTMLSRKRGDEVNIEVDMLARYVYRIISSMRESNKDITEEFLRGRGFL